MLVEAIDGDTTKGVLKCRTIRGFSSNLCKKLELAGDKFKFKSFENGYMDVEVSTPVLLQLLKI